MRHCETGHWSVKPRHLLSAMLVLGSLALEGVWTRFAQAQAVPVQAEPAKQDRGEAKRLVALGDRYGRANDSTRDDAKAAEYYAKAAELGDPTGMLRLGEALVYGRGVALDRARGLDLIEASVGAGNAAAMVSLSDLIARGLTGQGDRQRAVALLEQAANKGQAVAWVKLGAIYETGTLTVRDDRRAAAYYRKAIAAGRADAMVNLGRALADQRLKGQGSRAEGIALLRQAHELGNDNAVIALSDAYFNGSGVPRNAKQALSLLNDAWAAGNVKAATRLVALYRDGRGDSVKQDVARARLILKQVASTLPRQDLQNERLLMSVKAASTRAGWKAIGREFRLLPVGDQSALIRRVRSADQNVYIYLVQEELKQAGLFKSEPSGVLTAPTIRAIYQNCINYEASEVCRMGPLTPRVVDATSRLFLG